jgi:hypothetical protein
LDPTATSDPTTATATTLVPAARMDDARLDWGLFMIGSSEYW